MLNFILKCKTHTAISGTVKIRLQCLYKSYCSAHKVFILLEESNSPKKTIVALIQQHRRSILARIYTINLFAHYLRETDISAYLLQNVFLFKKQKFSLNQSKDRKHVFLKADSSSAENLSTVLRYFKDKEYHRSYQSTQLAQL